jgi:hypothetical protein
MRNLTLTIHFCGISQSFVSATKYENTSIKNRFCNATIFLIRTKGTSEEKQRGKRCRVIHAKINEKIMKTLANIFIKWNVRK